MKHRDIAFRRRNSCFSAKPSVFDTQWVKLFRSYHLIVVFPKDFVLDLLFASSMSAGYNI
jgi:hypothetical protein